MSSEQVEEVPKLSNCPPVKPKCPNCNKAALLSQLTSLVFTMVLNNRVDQINVWVGNFTEN